MEEPLHESTKDREITDNLVAAPDSRSPVSRIAQVDCESTREEREEPFAIWRIRREELLALRSCFLTETRAREECARMLRARAEPRLFY